jgi:hypothetical protein
MSLRKLERDFLQADIAAVNSLLAQLSEEDVLTRLGLQARLDELKRSIQELEEAAEQQTASAAIFFGGRPYSKAGGKIFAKRTSSRGHTRRCLNPSIDIAARARKR